jgi:glycosyltransferase involved in cell wall biosynthesis
MGSPIEVTILVPVLNRPQRVEPLLESVEAATSEPHVILFIADKGDTPELAALRRMKAKFITVDPPATWATKINEGYRRTETPWIFCGADDLHFHRDWFSRALEWAKSETGVIGTNDLCNPRTMTGAHSTHMLVRRSYIDEQGTVDEQGKVVHEGYAHEFADDELVQTAIARGVYVHAYDSLVEHLHPWAGKAEDDDTYRLGRQQTVRSRRLFRVRGKLWRHLSPPQTTATSTRFAPR